jgi:hypothetical protein
LFTARSRAEIAGQESRSEVDVAKENGRASVEALARHAVSQTCPEELGLFPATSTAYFADPQRALRMAKSEPRDDMLGFGVEAAVAVPAITTAALWVAQEVLKWVGSQVRDSLEEESATLIDRWVDRLLRLLRVKRDEVTPSSPEPLTGEQLARVREVARRKALDVLPEQQAVAVADAVVAGLVLPAEE